MWQRGGWVICQGLGRSAMSRVSRVIICQGLRGNNIARGATTCQLNLFMEVVHRCGDGGGGGVGLWHLLIGQVLKKKILISTRSEIELCLKTRLK